MNVLEEIQNNIMKKESGLSEYACKSLKGERLIFEKDDIRPRFFRDTDRIIYSFAYQRYMDKTQVFSGNINDRITKRMLHVQLVSKIGRTIGRALNLNEDLIEACSLGHDVGHVPFGHIGEKILSNISNKEGQGYFNHNIHSVRMLMNLENNGNGLNLCLQTLDGIMCHNGEILQNVYEPCQNKSFKTFFEEYNESYINVEKIKKIKPMTLEGCVVRISDVIAYIGKDIEDAISMNVIKKEELPESIIKISGTDNKSIVNELIIDIIEKSYDKSYLIISDKVYEALQDLIKFNYEKIYNLAVNNEDKIKIKKMYEYLYNAYLYDINMEKNETDINMFLKNMNKKYINNTKNQRKVIDYIAGMTDKYFLNQYFKIKKQESN